MRIAIVQSDLAGMDALRRAISDGHEVAWVAKDGADAIQQSRRDKPDLILMDLLMPGMDGAETTRRIMAQTPCTILIVTPALEQNASKIFEALGAGAFDVVQTPGSGEKRSGIAELKVKIAGIA